MTQNVRVLFCCTGVGIFNRGIESFFREAFDGIRGVDGVDALLVKGSGSEVDGEVVARCLPRTGHRARLVGRLLRRNAYVAEQLSSLPSVVGQIRRARPQVVFYSDANLGFQLHRFRRLIGVPFRLLFSNGGPCSAPFHRTDFVHQVAPFHYDEAVRHGEPPLRHHMVPYAITVPGPPELRPEERMQLRLRLAMPVDRPVLLSVGWISRAHKRMHYLIDEVARLPEPRPFVQMLGTMDESSPEVLELARLKLGQSGFAARSVPYRDVAAYYRAADLFALASLQEGFGRVYLEALMHGLPVIAHRHPVMEFVTGGLATLRDLTRPGELATGVSEALNAPLDAADMLARWQSVRDCFSWRALAPQYVQMFQSVAGVVQH